MARTAKGAIGEIVYLNYSPQNPGIIRGIQGKTVHVEWWKPRKGENYSDVHIYELKNFEGLVDDHERKGKKFRGILNELYSRV